MNTKTRAQQLDAKLLNVFGKKFRGGVVGDLLRKSLLTIVTLGLALLIADKSFAGPDLSVGGVIRHYPLSGVAEVEGGYGYLLRGEANSPFSSYVRGRLYGATALIYNSIDASIEVFPLAILGFKAGGEMIGNSKDYSAHDCERFNCIGTFNRTYIEAQGVVGAGPVFFQARFRRERWTQKNPNDGDFIDPTSAVAIRSNGDSQSVYLGILGYKVNDNWQALGILRYSENDQEGRFSRFPYAVVRYKEGPYSIGLGGGIFESDIKHKGFAAVASVRWEIEPSLAVR